MFKKISNNIYWLKYMVPLLIMLYFLFNYFTSSHEVISSCEKEKASNFKGVIKSIKKDPENFKIYFIYLENGEKIKTPYTFGLWIDVHVGDSLVKEKGTLNYIVFEKKRKNFKRVLKYDKPCK